MARYKYEDQGEVKKVVQICIQEKMIDKIGKKKVQQIAVQAVEREYLEFDRLEAGI